MRISGLSYLYRINNFNIQNGKEKTNVQTNAPAKSGEVVLNSNFYYPVSFKARKPRTFSTDKRKLAEKSGDFYIAKYNDIPCPACGKKMLNQRTMEHIADELAGIPQEEYLDYLGQYKESMRPVEESVYNELVELSKKPGNSKDIRTLLVQLRDIKMPILQKAQMKTVNKMRSLAKTLPDDEQAVLENRIKTLVGLIKKSNAEAPFRRKVVLDRISKIKIRNPYKYDKLQRIAKTFPTSSDMNSAWIVKYSGKNKMNNDWESYAIALRFLSSSVANTDHIIAYALENNHDDITNYMAMHSACNSQKGSKSFLQWLNEDKQNRIQFMRDYFITVGEMIDNRRIKKKKYRHYVQHAAQTVFEASKGQVQLFPDEDGSIT